MPNIALLDHILGDYSDKIKSLPSAPQPELSQMINDLSQVAYHHNDGKNTLQAIDLWEEALTNPNLNVDNLQKLFPLVFRLEQYSVRQNNPLIPESRIRSGQICQNLIRLNFSDDLWLDLFKNLLASPPPYTKSTKMLNKRTGDLISLLMIQSLPKLHSFLQAYKQDKVKTIPIEKLLRCTKAGYRSHYFAPFYVFNVSREDIRAEIKNRKHTTPKTWKNYTTNSFLPFFKELQSSIQKAKLERREFFKILKNRLLSTDDLVKKNEEYLETLIKMEESIKDQKDLIQDKLNKLKADSAQKID